MQVLERSAPALYSRLSTAARRPGSALTLPSRPPPFSRSRAAPSRRSRHMALSSSTSLERRSCAVRTEKSGSTSVPSCARGAASGSAQCRAEPRRHRCARRRRLHAWLMFASSSRYWRPFCTNETSAPGGTSLSFAAVFCTWLSYPNVNALCWKPARRRRKPSRHAALPKNPHRPPPRWCMAGGAPDSCRYRNTRKFTSSAVKLREPDICATPYGRVAAAAETLASGRPPASPAVAGLHPRWLLQRRAGRRGGASPGRTLAGKRKRRCWPCCWRLPFNKPSMWDRALSADGRPKQHHCIQQASPFCSSPGDRGGARRAP